MTRGYILRLLKEQWVVVAKFVAAIAAHPHRAALLGLFGLALLGIILTRSLPFALASTAPDFALWLNPNHPTALEFKAHRTRQHLLSMTQAEATRQTKDRLQGTETKIDGSVVTDETSKRNQASISNSLAVLRQDITAFAHHILANDPLNARAFRMLGEMEQEAARIRILMKHAFEREKRESAALFWLLNDSYHQNDMKSLLGRADILMRTRPVLTPYVLSYLGQVAAAPEGRALLVENLSKDPIWRREFFQTLPKIIRRSDTPLKVMLALRAAGFSLSYDEQLPYLDFLIRKKQFADAYNVWLQLLPEERLTNLGLINNADFEYDTSGLPFDWQIARPRNATAEVTKDEGYGATRALSISFGAGLVTFPDVKQLLVLTPGKHRFSALYKGTITATRGLRWRVTCFGNSKVLGETEMLLGTHEAWSTATMDVIVPGDPGCDAQTLVLVHDARSESEQFISGNVLFDNLKLHRIADLTQL